jgi:hypothetical protein
LIQKIKDLIAAASLESEKPILPRNDENDRQWRRIRHHPRRRMRIAGLRLERRDWARAIKWYLREALAHPEQAAHAYVLAARAARHLRGANEAADPRLLTYPLTDAQREQAADFYRRALAADPNHPLATIGLKQMLPADDPQALALLEQLHNVSPEHVPMIELGDRYRRIGKLAEAKQCYESVKSNVAYRRLDSLCTELGLTAEAKAWRRAASVPQTVRSLPVAVAIADEHGNYHCPNCGGQFDPRNPLEWDGSRHVQCNERVHVKGVEPPPIEPVWCVVANVGPHSFGPAGTVRSYTKHFTAGTKLYCIRIERPDAMLVVGRHRNSPRLVRLIVPIKVLANCRAKLVYKREVIDTLSTNGDGSTNWDGTVESQKRAEELIEWIHKVQAGS